MKFSVIIPAYNAESYIGHCLDSVLNQDYPATEYEVIVVDDCSPDNQNEIIKQYCDKYSNVQLVVHKYNKRQGGGRNSGLKAAHGEYVFFLDADDYWLANNVFKVFDSFLSSNDVDLIQSDVYVEKNNRSVDTESALPISGEIEIVDSTGYYSGIHHPCIWASVYKRTFIENIPFRENVFYEDCDWKIRTYLAATKIGLISFPFYAYFNNEHSTTRIVSEKLFIDGVEMGYIGWNLWEKSALPAELKERILSGISTQYINTVLGIRNYSLKSGVKLLRYVANSQYNKYIVDKLNVKAKFVYWSLIYIPVLLALSIKAATDVKRHFVDGFLHKKL